METYIFWLVLLIGLTQSRSSQESLVCNSTIEVYDSITPYLQVYPEPENRDVNKTALYFALVLSFGGQYLSSGSIPGVQVALDQINSDASILPGYELRYTLIETVVRAGSIITIIIRSWNSFTIINRCIHVKQVAGKKNNNYYTNPTSGVSTM